MINKLVHPSAEKSRKTRCRLVPAFVGVATKWLQRNFLLPAVSDKDGIFVVLSTVVWNQMLANQLSKCWYSLVAEHSISIREIKCQISLLCKGLSSFVSGSVVSQIREFVFNNKVIGYSKLQGTVKTHKPPPPGEVVVRPLHTSNAHVLNGLSAWIDKVLGSVLRHILFLCRHSRNVIKLARSAEILNGSIFIQR